jgi:hypothetical protein
MEAGVDMVSFDAFEFGETIAMYPDHVKRHLEEGKTLAWGVVPTGAALHEQTVDTLIAHYERMADHLVDKTGLDPQLVREQTLLTGSCGTGSMQMADAERVFELTAATATTLRERYGW